MSGADGGTGGRRRAPPASTYDVLFVQESLRTAGLYEGALDGVAGARTRLAARAWKRRHGLPVDDAIDAAFVRALRDALD